MNEKLRTALSAAEHNCAGSIRVAPAFVSSTRLWSMQGTLFRQHGAYTHAAEWVAAVGELSFWRFQ